MLLQKLLIIHQGALGDFVMTFPAIRRLRKQFNQIDVFCQDELGKMAQKLRVIDNWLPIEAPYFSSLYSNTVDSRTASIFQAYDKIVIFSFSTQLEQSVRGITRGSVHRIPPRPEVSQRIHVAEYILHQLVNCGLLKAPNASNGSILQSIEYPDQRSESYGPKRIILHPGSGSRKKNWPLQDFLRVESMLKSSHFKPEFILGPAEIFMAEDLQKEKAPIRRIHIIEDLTELAGLLKTSGGFIGNDSGVSHLAAFLGLPTVTIFGPSDPLRWKPIGRVVKAVLSEPDCGPCFETDKADCDEMECLLRITPEMVMNSFFKLVGG